MRHNGMMSTGTAMFNPRKQMMEEVRLDVCVFPKASLLPLVRINNLYMLKFVYGGNTERNSTDGCWRVISEIIIFLDNLLEALCNAAKACSLD